MFLRFYSFFRTTFMRYRCDHSGAASVENAVLWGIVGVLVASSGWALYNDVASVAQESSDHSERRDSMTTLSKTQKRAIITNPAAPELSSNSDGSRIHTSPGNDVPPEPPYEPWNEKSSVSFTIEQELLLNGNPDLPPSEVYRNIQTSSATNYKSELHDKCMSPVAGATAHSLLTYIGDDFNAANTSGCLFTRTILMTNNQGDFIPIYTTTMAGDLDSTSFVGSFFPDQLIQWTSSQRANCDPNWGGDLPSQQEQSCRDSFNDPVQNPECYSQNMVFSPSLCGAAPVVNSAGETIMWRSYFESLPLSWREPVDLKQVGVLGSTYTPYTASAVTNGVNFVPDVGRVTPYLSGPDRDAFVPYIPSTDTIDIITAPGVSSLLPSVNPGCSQSDNNGTPSNYEWGQSCNPVLPNSRLSVNLDGL